MAGGKIKTPNPIASFFRGKPGQERLRRHREAHRRGGEEQPDGAGPRGSSPGDPRGEGSDPEPQVGAAEEGGEGDDAGGIQVTFPFSG